MKIGDLFVGYNDGKKEARFRENFEHYYFNYNKIYEKILRDDKFLLLGKKGTGKTILGEYIKKISQANPSWFCDMYSCRELKFEALFALKTKSLKPNEYTAVWEWLLLIVLAKFILSQKDVRITDVSNRAAEKLRKFLNNCFMHTKLEMNKIIEITKSKKFSSGFVSKFLNFEKDKDESWKEGVCTYLDYLYDLKETVFEALSASQSTYTIILDELDDQFQNNELYKSNIISLIKTVDKINTEFLDRDIKAKFIIMLRNDIFYILNDSDLNKIEQDNSVKINWGTVSDEKSPLVNMVLIKLKQSMSSLGNQSSIDIEETKQKLFFDRIQMYKTKGKVKDYGILEFILGRTFLRPRDIITFLRLVMDSNPDDEYFTASAVKRVERDYSEYLIKEVKNEMHGHVDEIIIEESLALIRQYKRKSFDYTHIKQYYEKNKRLYPHIKIEDTLKLLFRFSVIGNFWNYKGKSFYSWAYRENTNIDFDKCFNIHIGLRKALNIS